MDKLIRLDIVIDNDDLSMATYLLARHISFGWEETDLPENKICLRLYGESQALFKSLIQEVKIYLPEARIISSDMENKDWNYAWREFFTPIEAGNFLILPPWLCDMPDNGQQKIIIEPKSAFGTGHHASTRLCLKALSHIFDSGFRPESKVLDLGCGSGILGIACAIHDLSVTAMDIDPVAIANTKENMLRNGVKKNMRVLSGSINSLGGQHFDLIIANILPEPLCDMAADIMARLNSHGVLILSGILENKAKNVIRHYKKLGKARYFTEGEWLCLFWQTG